MLAAKLRLVSGGVLTVAIAAHLSAAHVAAAQVAPIAGTSSQKRVPVFLALRKDAPVPASVDRDFQRILGDGLTEGLDYYSESIDAARFPDPDYVYYLALTQDGGGRNVSPVEDLDRFREPSIWDRYKYYIVTTASLLLLQTMLIAGLLVHRRKRRSAEEGVRSGEAELRTSYARIRDLAGRLISAQEAERMRIARELHDDVGQQLALLSIELEQLGASVRNGDQDALQRALDAAERTGEISTSVHDLSHQLHPPKLELMGLVVAVAGLRRELSAQHEVAIEFSHANVPATIPRDVSLCLFRIAQEGLRNAITHSGARQISVRLAGEGDCLLLSIADQGVGFDVGVNGQEGLGLLSMRERLEPLRGTVTVRSSLGAGTQIEVVVPVDRSPSLLR